MTECADTGEGHSFPTRTIVLMPAVGLPALTASPRWAGRFAHIFGFGGMTFDPATAPAGEADTVRRFDHAFRIDLHSNPKPWEPATRDTQAADEAARRLIKPTLMAALLDHPGWSFQTGDGWLACWRRHKVCPAGERPNWIAAAGAIRAALLAAAADPSPVILTPRLMPTGGQYMARLAGTFLGVLLGLFGGFFGTFFFFGIATTYGHENPALLLMLPFLSSAIGGGVLGILGFGIGAALGKVSAIARWTPPPQATPEQKAETVRRDSWQRGLG